MMRMRATVARTVVLALCLVSASANAADPTVTLTGLGGVKIEMTVAQAEKALRAKLDPLDTSDGSTESCWLTGRSDHAGPWVAYMISFGKIVRINVMKQPDISGAQRLAPPVASEKGIHIGALEEEVKTAYGSSLDISPHQYGGGSAHYLTVLAKNKRTALRFETFDGKVQRFYVGTIEAIELVEGCQ